MTTYKLIANIKGPQGNQGDRGVQGLPGFEDVPTDPGVAQLVKLPSLTNTALNSAYVSRKRVPLVIFIGESNSGGQALNTALTAAEKAVRPAVQILNNTTLTFEPLQIGVNNNLDHDRLPPTTMHGWEAGLADSAEAGEWADQVFLLKAGQGGSTLVQWDAGTAYSTKFSARFAAASAAIRADGYEPQVYIWMSIGINDHLGGTSVAEFGSRLIAWTARIRAITGAAPVMITRLPVPYDSYNAAIDQIDQDDPLMWGISTQNAPRDDVSHWSSAGMKRIARSMLDRSLVTVGQGPAYQSSLVRAASRSLVVGTPVQVWEPVKWTNASAGVTGDADGQLSGTAMNTGALGGAIDATKPFEIEIVMSASSQAVVVALSDTNAATFVFADPLQHFADVYAYGTKVFSSVGSASTAETAIASALWPMHIRLRKSGNDLWYSASTDGGLTFQDVYFRSGVLAGKTTIYLKALFVNAGAANIKVATRTLVN